MDFLKEKRKIVIICAIAVVLFVAMAATALTLWPEPEAIQEPVSRKPVTQVVPATPAPKDEVDPTWPLTGLPVSDESLTHNRPLSVKIENSYEARPQTGIADADVVYETLTEGGITRFHCIFQSTIPGEVGPVRSARNSDVTLVPQYQSLIFFSGANDLVLSQIADAGLDTMIDGAAGNLYYRVNERYAPHNLYLSLSGAYDAASESGKSISLDKPPSLEFQKEGTPVYSTSAKDASAIEIPFSDIFIATWSWDSATSQYLRSMDGPTMDAATDKQVAATNVVVMWANFTPDPVGGTTLEVNMNGSGQAMVFTNGKWIEGTWEAAGGAPPRFKDAAGQPIALTPGKTWFSVLQEGTELLIS